MKIIGIISFFFFCIIKDKAAEIFVCGDHVQETFQDLYLRVN